MRQRFIDFRLGFIAALVMALLGWCSTAHAADGAPRGWYGRLAPYFWAAGFDGDVTVGSRTVSVNKNFSDIFQHLDFGALGAGEVGYDNWSVFADVIYLDLSTDKTSPGPAAVSASASFQEWIATAALNWRLFASRWGSFKLLAGARYFNMSADLTLRLPERTLTPSATKDWFDPIIGARGRVNLPLHLFIPFYADIGGFDVGSRVSSNGYAGLGYTFGWLDVVLAYRYLYYDYKETNFKLDAVNHGLEVGVVFNL